MTASILHPHEWTKGTVQPFLSVAPGRDEIILYESDCHVRPRQAFLVFTNCKLE